MFNGERPIKDIIEGRSFLRTNRVSCPLCNIEYIPNSFNVRFGQIASITECQHCRIAFQTPQPSLEASAVYMNMRWNVANKNQQLDRAIEHMKLVNIHFKKSWKILDFGAGIGTFVRLMQENGWQSEGID